MKRQQATPKPSAPAPPSRGVATRGRIAATGKQSDAAAATRTVKPGTAAKPSAVAKPGAPKATKAGAARTAAHKPVAARRDKSPATPAPAPNLYSSIHAMLHTMRVIERHEEPLCSMQDELKRTGRLSAQHRRKLQQLVDELPADIYRHDLEALRRAVGA